MPEFTFATGTAGANAEDVVARVATKMSLSPIVPGRFVFKKSERPSEDKNGSASKLGELTSLATTAAENFAPMLGRVATKMSTPR